MRYYTPVLIALATPGVLLAAGGCGATAMSEHGKAQSIVKPRHAGEAMDFYYDK